MFMQLSIPKLTVLLSQKKSFCCAPVKGVLCKNLNMKKLIFALSVLVFCACGDSKKKVAGNETDHSLQTRLDEFMKVNDEMNFEKIMDYTYPKLFTIVPRTQLMETIKEGFDNKDFKIELDSLRVDSLYPVFQSGKGSYAKIRYSMVMLFYSKDTSSVEKDSSLEMIRQSLATKYGEENVILNEAAKLIRIRISSPMAAVKDEYAKEWSFVNLNTEDDFIKKLFDKEVLDKLATYN